MSVFSLKSVFYLQRINESKCVSQTKLLISTDRESIRLGHQFNYLDTDINGTNITC